jgi:hypothetical protein
MGIVRLALSGRAALVAMGMLAVWVSDDPASGAAVAKRCQPYKTLLNGECVENSFINPDLPNTCSGGASCYRRTVHKHKAPKTNK